MPSICAYPARPWACDSSVTMATLHQGLPWIPMVMLWTLGVGSLILWVILFLCLTGPSLGLEFQCMTRLYSSYWSPGPPVCLGVIELIIIIKRRKEEKILDKEM